MITLYIYSNTYLNDHNPGARVFRTVWESPSRNWHMARKILFYFEEALNNFLPKSVFSYSQFFYSESIVGIRTLYMCILYILTVLIRDWGHYSAPERFAKGVSANRDWAIFPRYCLKIHLKSRPCVTFGSDIGTLKIPFIISIQGTWSIFVRL